MPSEKGNLVRISNEVWFQKDPISFIGPREIDFLKNGIGSTEFGRMRICFHQNETDPVHEMLIAITGRTYIRPARHVGKPESLMVVDGLAEAVFLDEEGLVEEVTPLGPSGSGRCNYYRMETPVFHTLLVETDFFIFHECTKGPLLREQTEFPDWAPLEENRQACLSYMRDLKARADEFRIRSKN